ncbi:DsbA family oxidoreductase [Acidimicrobiia bacterium EGI L10123]|uniref:DsbA family oxidoreductase n=1 Tax=Salinilacustrithrix flava TaxID=2957203 RepID=UPI003D7C2B9A|nr:DsbA family oxidoreductase [Acidimicrobiia bacterium EGI L10123]
MRIDVWSDVVCPWCYLGKRRLEVALEGLDFADEVEVRWRAFQLDPTATAEPKDLATAIDRKYGPGAFQGMTGRLVPLGEEVGIDYRFDLAQRVTSLPALSLVAWVESEHGPDTAAQLHDRLFRAYFTEGANIADAANLVEWAVDVGADRELAGEAVATGTGRDAVASDLEGAADRQITGVPAFVIEDSFMIPGAQDVDTIRNLLTRMHERRAAS